MSGNTKSGFRVKNVMFVFCVFAFTMFLSSCLTINNKQKKVVYAEIQNEISQLDALECRDWLENYIAKRRHVIVRIWDERNVNWGHLVVRSPIRASTDLYIKGYKYRKDLDDPREIYYLINYMRSFPLKHETLYR